MSKRLYKILRDNQNALLDNLVCSTHEESKIFELIFKETVDSIFSIDANRTIKIINPAMEKFLGLSGTEVKGKKCYEILKWKNAGKTVCCKENCPVMKAFHRGENSVHTEGLLEIRPGQKKWVGTTASCVRNHSGSPEEIILVMRDITGSKKLQQKLEADINIFETLAVNTRGIELKIPCMSEFAITARAQAELIARRMKFKTDRIQDIKSAVGEACDNAIEHGNSRQGVDIRYKVRGTNLLIEVEDYGEGFESDRIGFELPSPFLEGGRGLFLIKNLADDVEILSSKGQGTKVVMEIYRKPAPLKRWNHKRAPWRTEKKTCVM